MTIRLWTTRHRFDASSDPVAQLCRAACPARPAARPAGHRLDTVSDTVTEV
jgi:hypothetical protein